jgi:uncharacterized protein (TIGR03083 family)
MENVEAAVHAERREQADLLATLTPEQWNAPTLCAGWRVREVIAHTTAPYRMSTARFLLDLAKARGNFHRMADRSARHDATAMSPEQLLNELRANITHPWAPPGGGPRGALSHDVIHGLDITVALDLDRRPAPERVALVLDGLRPKNVAYFGTDLTGVSLRATDLDWSYGTGTPVSGAAQDLLLVICGRRLPAGRLEGDAAGRFSRAASTR